MLINYNQRDRIVTMFGGGGGCRQLINLAMLPGLRVEAVPYPAPSAILDPFFCISDIISFTPITVMFCI